MTVELAFDGGLLPAIAQDVETGEVLMLAFVSPEAVARTRETGLAHYYSRSREELWQKGESSGHVQHVDEIRVDCDGDSLLYLVDQTVAACHTGFRSCFHRRIEGLDIGDDAVRAEASVREERVFDPAEVYE